MFRKLVTAALLSVTLSTSALASDEWMKIGADFHSMYVKREEWINRCSDVTRICAEQYKANESEVNQLFARFPVPGSVTCKVTFVSYDQSYGGQGLPVYLHCDPEHSTETLLYVNLASFKCKGPAFQGRSRFCNTEQIFVGDTITVEGSAVNVEMYFDSQRRDTRNRNKYKGIGLVKIGHWESDYVTKVTVKK
jgi:hypothetical protein